MTLPYRAYNVRKINDNLPYYTPKCANVQAESGGKARAHLFTQGFLTLV